MPAEVKVHLSGYAESLIVSQYLDGIQDLKRLQKFVLKTVNYFPKHLMEFLVSASLIEEILAKNDAETKNKTTDNILVPAWS